MGRLSKRILSCLFALTAFIGCTQAAEVGDENFEEILAHNIEIKSVWLNPGEYISQDIGEEYIELATEIVGDSTEDMEKLKKIYDWVTSNIYYDHDGMFGFPSITEEEQEAGMTTLQLKRGVCETYAAILKKLLNAEGIPSFVIHGRTCDQSTAIPIVDTSERAVRLIGIWTPYDVESTATDHAWNAVYIDGEWIEVDSTWDSTNTYRDGEYIEGSSRRGYFNPGDVLMSYSHKIITYAEASESDTPDQWAMAEISSAFANKLVPYDLQGNYREAITRKDFCRLAMSLWRCIKGSNNEDGAESPFDDTEDVDVIQAYNLGIVRGVSSTQFDPNRKITREEAATMLMRVAKLLEYPNTVTTSLSFSDMEKVSDWGLDGVNYVSAKGIMQGDGDCFNPKANYTTQQAIATFYRIFNSITQQ